MAKKSKIISVSCDQQALNDLESIRSALKRSYSGSDNEEVETVSFTNSFVIRSAIRFYADALEQEKRK